ncbi:MAG: hypothetical protein DRP10_02970 [Candidatus Aenigmatarchaeota archaeon]|nr:MAG: hypothetical protein DRP10_02970 [Candidatus Aenigmarchaeota archaeon]
MENNTKGEYLFEYYKDRGLIDKYIRETENFTIRSLLDYLCNREEDKEELRPYVEEYIKLLLKQPSPSIEIEKIDLNKGIIIYKQTESAKKFLLRI